MLAIKQTFDRAGGRALRLLEQRPATAAAAKSLRAALVRWRRTREMKAEGRLIAAVAPLVPIPYAAVDLRLVRDPLPAIYAAPELEEANKHLCRATTASASLVSAMSQALLYSLVRNLRPDHVFEIGTYLAGTAEVICRALQANGHGVLHTTDPFGAVRVPAVVAHWPPELRDRLRFYPLDSMAFFGPLLQQREIRPDLVFVDGNHDYEYALFDIGCAARMLRPGGFIVIDNVSQAGPYLAARDFIAAHPDWLECRVDDGARDPTKAFDGDRSRIPHTDFIILRAPGAYHVASRPTNFGELTLGGSAIAGLQLSLGEPGGDGVVHAQCVLRGFSTSKPSVEHVAAFSQPVSPSDAGAVLRLPMAIDIGPGFDAVRLETWLTWSGAAPLPLAAQPTTY